MSGSRPSIFLGDEDLDLSRFRPKTVSEKVAVSEEVVRQIAEEGGFPSRAPKPRAAAKPQLPKRPILAKSGRTELLNARITKRAHDEFHDIVEAERLRYEAGEITHRVTLGEMVERALAALKREMAHGGMR